jgi:hypothetical protein
LSNSFLPADRCRDTKTAAECIFRSKNCGSRFLACTISNKNPQNFKIFNFLETYEFKNGRVEASFVFFVVDLRVSASIFAKRVFWAVDAAGGALGAAGTRTAAL